MAQNWGIFMPRDENDGVWRYHRLEKQRDTAQKALRKIASRPCATHPPLRPCIDEKCEPCIAHLALAEMHVQSLWRVPSNDTRLRRRS